METRYHSSITKYTTVLALFAAPVFAQSLTLQSVSTTASLRGVYTVNRKVAWASGTGGTYLRTIDGGAIWNAGQVPGAQDLDFRDVHAVNAQTAYLLASGPGAKSKIFKTTDGGSNWTLQFTNPDANGFFDSFAFWDATHGILVGDPVDGQFVVLSTSDGGATWVRQKTPPALDNEGAFAASGTCIAVRGRTEVWFATGGRGGARVFHSDDAGESWTVTTTPIRNDEAAAGIFSLAFSKNGHGIAVGGDFSKPNEAEHTVAITADDGETWTEPEGHPDGYRSAVQYLPRQKAWIAVGTTGASISRDGGLTWKEIDKGPFNAISFPWAVGPKGRVARVSMK
jgi:photosystem II stability/assembly factor-like uncharacterized protein